MANLCVSLLGLGSADGSDWANSLAQGFTPIRGNTYYYATGTYSAKTFSVATSSTTLTTIKKATVEDHGPETGWSDAYAETTIFGPITFSTSYWIFDGQIGGGPSPVATGHGFNVFSSSSVLCTLSGTVSNITLRHVDFNSDRGATFIAGIKGTTGAVDSLIVEYCAITDVFGPVFHMKDWTNCTIQYNYFSRNKSTADDHSEGVSSIGTNVNLLWNANYWEDIEGTAVYAGVNFGTSDQWTIQNSVFVNCVTTLYYYWEDPGTNQNLLTNASIYNNTIIGSPDVNQSVGGFAAQMGSGNVASNNLFYGVASNSFSWENITHNYSWAYGNYRNGVGQKDTEIVSGEANGVIGIADPFISATNFRLNSTTTAIGAGADLSAYFTTDADGLTRTIPWDIGAYAYEGAAGTLNVTTLNVTTMVLG